MTWTRERGRCPECGGAILEAGPIGSGRLRRSCLRTCSHAPKDEAGLLAIDRSPAHAKRMHDARLGRAGLVTVRGLDDDE